MRRRFDHFGTARWVLAIAAIALILIAWQQVLSVGRGLVVRNLVGEGGTPLRYLAPEDSNGVPGVVIAHGFAGSKQLMYGYGYDLARAGYGVMLLDFDGHGAARGKLDREGNALQRNLAAAYDTLAAQPEVDAARIAILGHSMGSGAVMTAAIDAPERYRATVAISPTGAAVTPDLPRNLLLMAGSLEPQFLGNAQDLLARAGGPNDELSSGLGRALVEVPNVEHISILFSRLSRQATLDWLNRTFDLPHAGVAADRRILWFAAHLGGWLLLAVVAAPLLPASPSLSPTTRRKPWHWLGLVLGALAAAVVLSLAGRLFDTGTLGGLLVGGSLGLWFFVLGVVWLFTGFRPPRLAASDFIAGILLFLFLTLAFGVMSQLVWLNWALVPERLIRWPLLAVATLPWQLASGLVQHRASPAARFGWWLLQSAVIVAGLGLTVVLAPGLFFVALLMPVFPLVIGVLSIAGAAVDRPWAVGIGNALFIGWILVAVFPLA